MDDEHTSDTQAESQHLNREAATLIDLGNLLRKQRTADGQRRVEEVLSSPIDNSEKLKRILEIDRHLEEKGSTEPGPPVQEERSGSASRGSSLHELRTAKRGARRERNRQERYYGTVSESRNGPVRRKRARVQFNLKRPFNREGYLSFLLRHYRRMKEFGYASRTMSPRVFPPGVRLNPELRSYLQVSLKHNAKDASSLLAQLMGNSWLYLRKKEYNLLVLILELCTLIRETDFSALDMGKPTLIDSLKKLEQQYITLSYHTSYLDAAIHAVQELIKRNRRSIEGLDRLPVLIRSLLSRQGESPSLSEALLAMNMFKYRRYLGWEDLMHPGIGEVVETGRFDCTPETQQAIDGYVQKLLGKLKNLDKERKEILKLRTYLTRDENDQIELAPLKELYERGGGPQRSSFEQDVGKLPLFAQRLTQAMRRSYEDLLNGTVELSRLGKVRLFEEHPFHNEVSMLQRLDAKLEDVSFQLPSFPKKRYLEIKVNRAQAVAIEAEAVSLLNEVMEVIRSIGEKLHPLLRKAEAGSDREMRPDEFTPVDVRVSGSQAGVLPLANIFYHPTSIENGKHLFQLFHDLLRRCYLIRYLFDDPRITHPLRRESQVEQEMQSVLETLERIADLDIYMEAKEQYG